MSKQPVISYESTSTDKGEKCIAVCRVNKEHFANMIEDQINKCLNNNAPYGALMIIYSAMDTMSGGGKVSDWADTYMLNSGYLVSGIDIWGSRNALVHSMDIHDVRRDKRKATYRPLLFHCDEDSEGDMLMISHDWDEKEWALDEGTTLIDLDKFANAFIKGMKDWVKGKEPLNTLVHPILYPSP